MHTWHSCREYQWPNITPWRGSSKAEPRELKCNTDQSATTHNNTHDCAHSMARLHNNGCFTELCDKQTSAVILTQRKKRSIGAGTLYYSITKTNSLQNQLEDLQTKLLNIIIDYWQAINNSLPLNLLTKKCQQQNTIWRATAWCFVWTCVHAEMNTKMSGRRREAYMAAVWQQAPPMNHRNLEDVDRETPRTGIKPPNDSLDYFHAFSPSNASCVSKATKCQMSKLVWLKGKYVFKHFK